VSHYEDGHCERVHRFGRRVVMRAGVFGGVLLWMFILGITSMLTGCPLVEVKIVNTSIMDRGDNTKDNYRDTEQLSDEEVLQIEADLIR